MPEGVEDDIGHTDFGGAIPPFDTEGVRRFGGAVNLGKNEIVAGRLAKPEAQTAGTRGSPVELVMIATGIEVPKLVGMPFGKAKKAIEAAGLTVGKVRETFDDYKDPWVVLSQAPEPGTRVAKGASIDLVRNEGD